MPPIVPSPCMGTLLTYLVSSLILHTWPLLHVSTPLTCLVFDAWMLGLSSGFDTPCKAATLQGWLFYSAWAFMSLVKFISRYVFLLDVIINEIVYIISFWIVHCWRMKTQLILVC